MTQKPEKQNTAQSTMFTQSVLERIEREQVVPRSKMTFMCINSMIWVAWALTVIFGAISVAVMIFVGDHARFALYEATHTTSLSFFIEVLPYIWITIFFIMSTLAYINFKHTKSGYRYPIHHILISSIVFSIVGGAFLHVFGVGALIDSQIGKRMPVYGSMEKLEMKMWQMPKEGRLVGVFDTVFADAEKYTFVDAQNETWEVDVRELRELDWNYLMTGHTVRVLGTSTDVADRTFIACGVFPWMYDKKVSMRELRADRKAFVERMYTHMDAADRLKGLQNDTFGTSSRRKESSVCAEIAVMKRMRF